MSDLVYFSAADRQMENFLDKDAFDRSLLLNVLFQAGILVPDILFCISRGLEAHLQNPNLTLFEACIEDGIIVPSFRSARAASFVEAFRLIQQQEIQGVRESAERTMRRLQCAAERNKAFRPSVWKEHVGSTFDKRLMLLQSNAPPIIGPTFGMSMSQGELQKYWLLTEHWRTLSINEAREATRQKAGGGYGVRRGEILNAVARELVPGSQPKIEDIASLFEAYPEKPELRVFFQWVCEIYAYNHAVEMDCVPNLPAYNAFSVVSLGSSDSAPPPVMQYTSFPSFSETVGLPPLRVLKGVAPRELLAVRKNEGAQYLADLATWQTDPNSAHLEDVGKSLRKYAAKIVKLCQTEVKSPVNVFLSHLPPQARFWATSAGGYAVNQLRQHNPEAALALGSFIAVASFGYAVYQGLYQKPKKQIITLAARPPELESEVNVLQSEASAD